MAARPQTLSFKATTRASASDVYRAFTRSAALREWWCDMATTEPTQGGRVYLWWPDGYYTSGQFTALAPAKKVAFTWHGRDESAASRVQISIAEKNGGATVSVSHTGFGSGPKAAQAVKQLTQRWQRGLENLQSVFESGEDLRLTKRPMLGILVGEFNAEAASKLGSPASAGVMVDGVVQGMGAAAAGLQHGDVLVNIGGKKVTGWASLGHALQGRRAGESVPVVLYRGREKKKINMTLSQRPLPEIPATAQALAEAVRKIYAPLDVELADCFKGVSEEESSFKPGPAEWSAKDVVAHLLVGERDSHSWIADVLSGEERWYDDSGGNINLRHAGIFAAHPTLPALLDEYRRAQKETIAMLAGLPADFVARRSGYWRIAYSYLQPPTHTRDHFTQIRAAIEAARKK